MKSQLVHITLEPDNSGIVVVIVFWRWVKGRHWSLGCGTQTSQQLCSLLLSLLLAHLRFYSGIVREFFLSCYGRKVEFFVPNCIPHRCSVEIDVVEQFHRWFGGPSFNDSLCGQFLNNVRKEFG